MLKSNEELMQENTELKEEVAELKRQLSVLKKMAFGSKSEKTKQVETNPEQISLFNEAETEQSVSAREEEKEIVVTGHSRKKKRTRDEIFLRSPGTWQMI